MVRESAAGVPARGLSVAIVVFYSKVGLEYANMGVWIGGVRELQINQ